MKRNQKSATKERYLTTADEEWFDHIADNTKIAFASPGNYLDSLTAKMMSTTRPTGIRKWLGLGNSARRKPYSTDMTAAWEVFNWAVNGKFRRRRNFFKAVEFLTGQCLSYPEILTEYRSGMPGLICRAALIAHLKESGL